MKYIIFLLLLFSCLGSYSQVSQIENNYQSAFRELNGMLNDSIPLSFKRAVFVTENAYTGDAMDYREFDLDIQYLAGKAKAIASQGGLHYKESDKESVEKYGAVFRLMTDTLHFYSTPTDVEPNDTTFPFLYDFDDFEGDKDWRKMFVSKLLVTNKGNCHSLPFLYKILCEEIGSKAYLSMAPNHIYIKLWCKKSGWYNTELTSGYFPIDAWIMASGYIPISAVQNRIYMDTLSQKQSLAVCLVDLAKGYERKMGHLSNLNFIAKCTDLALRHYPKYVNGLLLQAETTKKRFEEVVSKNGLNGPDNAMDFPEAKKLFDIMQSQYMNIHNLGYRKMPKEMYANWLSELKRERDKYQNKKLIQDVLSNEK